MMAACFGYNGCVRQLLEARAGVNAVDDMGRTPLERATTRNSIVVQLLQAGVAFNAVTVNYDDDGVERKTPSSRSCS